MLTILFLNQVLFIYFRISYKNIIILRKNIKYYVNQQASLVLPMSESEDDLRLILKSDSREEEEFELKEETFTIPEIVL